MKHFVKHVTALIALALPTLGFLTTSASAQSTLERVKARGHLICGTSQGVPGFSAPDDKGNWTGFDTDFCRALAAAIFNDPNAAKYVSLSSKDRLIALQSSSIDVLARTTTWTSSRDTGQGVQFTAINYFDGQGFLVRKSLNVKSGKELNGATVCVSQGTTNELNLADFTRTNNIKLNVLTFSNTNETAKGYDTGRCDVYTTDRSQLAAQRLQFAKPDDHILLPDTISKEPLGAWVRKGDDQWFTFVRWTLFAMLLAEEHGVTKANIDEMLKSTNPEIRRLLGLEGDPGVQFGVTNDWAVRIIRHVGNYGETFERHLGPKTPVALDRGLNKLWTQGGLHYAPPIR
ncbi:MAG: amino acid ABC transporter substrate-binding protein [Hyphomicrobiaceae bacterium]|nr:amino acid ABC transporter substrate-binding protein [Hyphomicrobiaceae bacterium]